MKKYIELEALLSDISESVLFTVRGGVKTPTAEMRGANKVIDRIKSAPAADVVDVVRCKDCKYWVEEKDFGMFCSHWGSTLAESQADDFCSYGEAKMDGKGEGV